jgi:hypothetical protein
MLCANYAPFGATESIPPAAGAVEGRSPPRLLRCASGVHGAPRRATSQGTYSPLTCGGAGLTPEFRMFPRRAWAVVCDARGRDAERGAPLKRLRPLLGLVSWLPSVLSRARPGVGVPNPPPMITFPFDCNATGTTVKSTLAPALKARSTEPGCASSVVAIRRSAAAAANSARIMFFMARP